MHAWQASCSPEGGAQGDVAHEDDVQQQEGGGKEPVNVAHIVDAAQVSIRVQDVGAAAKSTLHGIPQQSHPKAAQSAFPAKQSRAGQSRA